MAFPIRKCVICKEEFELKPDKPGYANRCPNCSEEESLTGEESRKDSDERRTDREADAERRKAIRDLLYRKDS